MKKYFIMGAAVIFSSAFFGHLCYDLVSSPDGYLYLDKDTKNVYAMLNKDPDEYKPNSKLVFVFKG